ncbi:MAG: PKD domain-containing protein [Planctomycetota bacterium]|nr:MAG: PKD domain-containing protein [Planctomycetota bacterium]
MKADYLRFVTVVSVIVIAASINRLFAVPPGPLGVHSGNPRYFDDSTGKALYLTGAHTWAEFQDYYVDTPFTYSDWLGQLVGWNHNFMRGWTWEDDYYLPMPFTQSGGKYNLDTYNATFFERYKSRIQEAADNNLYLSIMLFQGWSVQDKGGSRIPDPWPHHPYKLSNNNNNIDGDTNGDGEGLEVHTLQIPAVTALQEDYVEHFIDELNAYDNIIWEISNESHSGSESWQYYMVDHIHSYEAAYKPKQHLVWINVGESEIYHSANHADIVSPSGSTIFRTDPPAASGQKIVIADSDHTGPLKVTYDWAWKNFTRGNHPILMDCSYDGLTWSTFNLDPTNPKWQQMRDALGVTRTYANQMDLEQVIPQNGGTSPSTTGYCLYQTTRQYMVYQPGTGSFNLSLSAGSYRYDWIHPLNGTYQTDILIWGGGSRTFTPPFSGKVALFLFIREEPVAVIDANPTIGLKPLTVNFDGSGSYDPNGRIVSYQWDFDNDGNTDATGVTASHQYTEVNDYIAALKVTDNDGMEDTATVNISVVYPLGDFDSDYDVDQEDFGNFQQCMTGTGNPQNNPECQKARLDSDEDVDLNDVVTFIGCMSGADVPQNNPACVPLN